MAARISVADGVIAFDTKASMNRHSHVPLHACTKSANGLAKWIRLMFPSRKNQKGCIGRLMKGCMMRTDGGRPGWPLVWRISSGNTGIRHKLWCLIGCQNARTTPHIRALMVNSYRSGEPVRSIAAHFSVSANTVYCESNVIGRPERKALQTGEDPPAEPRMLMGRPGMNSS